MKKVLPMAVKTDSIIIVKFYKNKPHRQHLASLMQDCQQVYQRVDSVYLNKVHLFYIQVVKLQSSHEPFVQCSFDQSNRGNSETAIIIRFTKTNLLNEQVWGNGCQCSPCKHAITILVISKLNTDKLRQQICHQFHLKLFCDCTFHQLVPSYLICCQDHNYLPQSSFNEVLSLNSSEEKFLQ